MPDEDVIAAIADPSRRALLDALRVHDGQTVSELGACLPQLGRHAVLKHIGVLEGCDLVVTRKVGRQRYCYLNPVPIVELARRWLDSYTAFWAGNLTDLRAKLETEGDTMSTTPAPAVPTKHRHVHKIVIAAPIERVWQAITDEAESASWYYGTGVVSTWEAGAPYEYRFPDGRVAIAGTVQRSEPPTLLVMTFSARWSDEVAVDAPTRVTFELSADGKLTTVVLTHDDVVEGTATAAEIATGWPYLLSNLKSYVETGKPMPR
jgi:uncharacterized protein YndB with AHSA1/START domain/DNA-binding transcriptional ArsR family regulator